MRRTFNSYAGTATSQRAAGLSRLTPDHAIHRLFLDLFFEGSEGVAFAQQSAVELRELVQRLAPHVSLNIEVRAATNVLPWEFNWQGQLIQAVRHDPSADGRQSVLITDHLISGAQGWGGQTYGVVSRPRMLAKNANGGAAVDILIHEWIHTIQGIAINGRPVPFADDAIRYGFVGELGPDNEERWEAWYAYALGIGHLRERTD